MKVTGQSEKEKQFMEKIAKKNRNRRRLLLESIESEMEQ